jgi:hypothetical protein
MATTHRYREETSSWALTSLAVSFVVHLLLMHFLSGFRLFDVERFTSTVQEWFNVVDVQELVLPETRPIPEDIPEQAAADQEPEPEDVPLLEKQLDVARPALGEDTGAPASEHTASRVRLPHTQLPLVLRAGTGGFDQTETDLGMIAPVRSGAVKADPAPTATRRKVGQGLPGLVGPKPAELEVAAMPAPRPDSIDHSGERAPLKTTADATPETLGDAPPVGILIPMDGDDVAETVARARKVDIAQANVFEDDDNTPVIPLGDEVAVNTVMYAEPGNPLLYFRMEVAIAKREKLPAIPKDVVFIVDVSLSMRWHEIRQTREAIVSYLTTLTPSDRFNIVVFSEAPLKLFPDFMEVTPERVESAGKFVNRIAGQIKTDVYRVLRAVMRDVATHSASTRPTNIFFVSDGKSTSGIRDVRRIVNDIGAFSRPNFAIFAFDAGGGGDRYLLDLLSYRSRGTATYVDDVRKAGDAQVSLFRQFDQPLLMQLQPTYTNLKVEETYPTFLPNLYASHPVVIYGRCTPGQNVTIRLQGKNPYSKRALVYSHTPGEPDPARADIAREWARRKIHHLAAEMARFGETPTRKAEMERLGRKYGLPTPYKR